MKNVLIVFLVLLWTAGMGQNISDAYPIPPKTKDLLFYIQRNHNKNTIIYDANFDEKGSLIKDLPIDVHWIRYEEEGQRMELRPIEKMLAYGVRCKKLDDEIDKYNVKLVAKKKKEFQLIQDSPYVAKIMTLINNKPSVLDHIYLFADNSGIWPKIKYVELYGSNAETGEKVYEKIIN
jgi:hypothetical protein